MVNNGKRPTDKELILRAREDPEAFAMLYERYVDRMYAYFYYRTGSHADAEELTSRFFHRLIERLHLFQDRGAPVSAWLYRIAHNMLANWRRDQARQQLLYLKFVEELPNAEIGRIMGRTEGAIKSLYHRTLVSLRNRLQREGT